ncbi:hypothetical protein OHA62_31395 [Streptomyces sp. NBC_00343]|nr:hypothetical protein [Streptomyces sp. NBC_00343]
MCRGLAIATARARRVRAPGVTVVPDRAKPAVIPAAPATPPPRGAPLVFGVLVIRTPGVPVTVRDHVPGAVVPPAPAIPPPCGAALVFGVLGVFLVAGVGRARALVRGAVRLRVGFNSACVGLSRVGGYFG